MIGIWSRAARLNLLRPQNRQNKMPTPAEDRKYLESALVELKSYLLTDILFYPLASPLPRLTLGGVLLAQRRLQAYEDASPLDHKLDTLRTKWLCMGEESCQRSRDSHDSLAKLSQ